MAQHKTGIEWRAVPSWPGFYVTRDGAIKGPSGQVLKPMRAHRGHLFVTYGRESRKLYVHRAVLFAFVGPPELGQESRHLNGKPADNRLSNLCWGTLTEQREDDRRNGVSRRGKTKLTPARVRAARRFARLGLSTRSIGARLGVSHTSIRKVLSGERWSDV